MLELTIFLDLSLLNDVTIPEKYLWLPVCKFSKSITSGVKCPAPDCEGELIERRSKRGDFYGCTKFPKCTYTARALPKDEVSSEST